jgi:hypothetical protein
MRTYVCPIQRGIDSVAWLVYKINTPLLRDIFMSSFDLFERHPGGIGPRFLPTAIAPVAVAAA